VGVIVYFPRLIFTLFSARNNSAITLSGLQTGKILFCYKSCELLQHTATHVASYCNTLQHTLPLTATRYRNASYCNTLQHTLQHAATQSKLILRQVSWTDMPKGSRVWTFCCNTLHYSLQHTATHFNTLQTYSRVSILLQHIATHVATRCNTLQTHKF